MENASKALIIAGAILLAIAIIGVGMLVFSNARDAISDTGMTKEQVAVYNSTFTNYQGTQRGSNVKTMCNTIVTHNLTATDDSEKVQVLYGQATKDVDASDVVESNTTTTHINDIRDKSIQSGVSYTITFGYDNKKKKITTVYINEI